MTEYEITKQGDEYVATGEGLVGMGKTKEQAVERLEYEIKELKGLYKDVLGKEEADKIFNHTNHADN